MNSETLYTDGTVTKRLLDWLREIYPTAPMTILVPYFRNDKDEDIIRAVEEYKHISLRKVNP